jgi:ADP-ribosyl-[dinitrogen reductase] hydrolase
MLGHGLQPFERIDQVGDHLGDAPKHVACSLETTMISLLVGSKCSQKILYCGKFIVKNDKLEGGLVGLLVGDALGVPYEFCPPEKIPPYDDIEFTSPSGFVRAHHGVAPGTWSDDGAQALCLLSSLISNGRLDPNHFAMLLLKWYKEGFLAVDQKVFDIGTHTARVLQAILNGMPALEAGQLGYEARGNGSLMRSLPLALWHKGSDHALVTDAVLQSQVTHGDLYCQICCALYCLWARRFLEEVKNPWISAVDTLKQIYADNCRQLEVLDAICSDEFPRCRGTGYVVDCLSSARLALEAGGYEQVVKAAIAFGNDTDTTACVAGGIAGIRDGINGIPERWRKNLRGQELSQPLITKLLQHWH